MPIIAKQVLLHICTELTSFEVATTAITIELALELVEPKIKEFIIVPLVEVIIREELEPI